MTTTHLTRNFTFLEILICYLHLKVKERHLIEFHPGICKECETNELQLTKEDPSRCYYKFCVNHYDNGYYSKGFFNFYKRWREIEKVVRNREG